MSYAEIVISDHFESSSQNIAIRLLVNTRAYYAACTGPFQWSNIYQHGEIIEMFNNFRNF